MRTMGLISISSAVCAACLLLVSEAAVAQEAPVEQEVWFVSDVIRSGDVTTFDCAAQEDQSGAAYTASILRWNGRKYVTYPDDVMLLTTETNNCRDYEDANAPNEPYTLFSNLWVSGTKSRNHNWYAVPGNHDYLQRVTTGGIPKWINDGKATAFRRGTGLVDGNQQVDYNAPTYRSFFAGNSWIVIGLDSELTGTKMEEQRTNLIEVLEASRAQNKTCQVAFFHKPAFSNGTKHGKNQPGERLNAALVDVLDAYNVELLLSGHEHLYERLGPTAQTRDMVQIVAGTGGAPLDTSWPPDTAYAAASQATTEHGAVRVLLRSGSYQVDFFNTVEGEPYDTYTGSCQW